MGFNATTAQVEPLDYDLTAWGGPQGVTPEPDNDRIQAFWNSYGDFFREQRDRLKAYQDRIDATDELGGDDLAGRARRKAAVQALEAEYEQDSKDRAPARIKQRCEIFAAVCSDQPDFDALHALPGRILDSFEAWLVDALSPKASRLATNN